MVEVGSSNLPATTKYYISLKSGITVLSYNHNKIQLCYFMKNFLIAFSFLFILAGCSSLELETVSSTEDHTKRILALGLSHEENLIEASKLDTPHLVSVVSLKLNNARDAKLQADIDEVAAGEFAKQVSISNNGLRFSGLKISESIKTGILSTDLDSHSYYLEGAKKNNSEIIQHKLNLMISHNSKNKREYLSANLCDKWGRCEDLMMDGSNNKLELKVLSVNASGCTSNLCNFSETLEIKLTDKLLNNSIENGLNLKLISKKKDHKIKISKPYLMGYLQVAQ